MRFLLLDEPGPDAFLLIDEPGPDGFLPPFFDPFPFPFGAMSVLISSFGKTKTDINCI